VTKKQAAASLGQTPGDRGLTPGDRQGTSITQFVVDVAGGDHGAFKLGTGAVFDAAEDSPLASSQFVQDT